MHIDSHQHFWQFDPIRDSWINDDMKIIQRDFRPVDLLPLLHENGLDGCVTVQSDQSEAENDFQLANAKKFDFIKGVVGWVDLRAPNVEERLTYYSSFEKMKGFRHVLQGETQRDLMLDSKFMNGISKLLQFDFAYDILILPDQLKYIPTFVSAFPAQRFVIDHIAKPNIREKKIEEWKADILAVASHQNLYCKISGMITEADWQHWKPEEIVPYIDIVANAFGSDRIMFGSDWPVCLVAGSYSKMMDIVRTYFEDFSSDEKNKFFGENAIKFYNLT